MHNFCSEYSEFVPQNIEMIEIDFFLQFEGFASDSISLRKLFSLALKMIRTFFKFHFQNYNLSKFFT